MLRLLERRRAGARRRGGFTLIELLVVMFIIAVLVALTAGATLKFIVVQRGSNTKTTLKKLYPQLQKKWSEATNQFRTEPMLPADPCTQAATNLAGLSSATSGDLLALTRVIYIKIKQRQAFPVTFAEATGGFVITIPLNGTVAIPPLPAYVAELKKYGITTGNAANPQAYESSVCLLMALKRGGGLTDEALGQDNISINVVPQKAPCLIDAWGYPIAFTRWPLGNTNTTQADPTDPPTTAAPQGLLAQMSPIAKTSFNAGVHALPNSGYLTPTIASMGPKGGAVLMLGSPGTATHWQPNPALQDQWNDVIYSNNLP
jgi:prepilin-type N-terminal cleavage/methylation domain-containing protein